MPKMHLSLQIQPRVPKEDLYRVVDLVIDMIRDSGLPYIVGAMETTIEGELDDLLLIVRRAHLICLEAGAERVGATIKTDLKPEGLSFAEKLSRYGYEDHV